MTWTYLKFFKKISLVLVELDLHCCAMAFSSYEDWGLLTAGASRCGAQALGLRALVAVVHGLGCSVACGIFLDQGSNPCPLHWEAESHPLSVCRSGSNG